MKNFFIALSSLLFTATTLNAQTFEFKNSGTEFILYDLSVLQNNANIAYAGGSQYTDDSAAGIIIKTEDAGESWTTIYEGENIQTIAFVNSQKGFAAGFANTIKKTEDGGASWREINVGSDVYQYISIRFWDENNGVIIYMTQDFEPEARTTTDGGETWNLSLNAPDNLMVKMNYADENTLFAVGFGGSVYKSTDAGYSWDLIKSGPEINLGVFFKDAMNGVVAGEEGDLYITNDGGLSWEDSLYTGYHHFYGLNWKGDKILAAGTDEDIYFSEDNGETFNQVFDGSSDDQMYEIALFADNSGLIVGSGGKVIKFSNLYMASNEVKNNAAIIYPNPATDVINIKTDKKINWVQLYDLSGKLLLNQKNLNSGASLNVSNLPKGIYILKINSEGQIHTQKFSKK